MSNCGKLRVGDQGQRYEVHYIERETKEDKRAGWSNEPRKLADAIRLMPSAESVYVLDRETNHRWEPVKGVGCEDALFCRPCGIVMRRDEKNKPCKGPTKMRPMEKGLDA